MDLTKNDEFKKLKDFIALTKREKVNSVRSNQISERKEYNEILAREVAVLRSKLGERIGLQFEGVIAARAKKKAEDEANKYKFPPYDPLASKRKNQKTSEVMEATKKR